MSRWWWALLIPVVLPLLAWATLVCFMGIMYPAGAPSPAIEETYRRKIAADLPPGSSRAQVEKWLNFNTVTHGRTMTNQGEGYWGFMRHSRWPDSGDVHIDFRFDKDGKLDYLGVRFQIDTY